ncbi:MAG: DUF2470 domain-containing protein [Burkholderiales bacterium]
MSAGAETRRYLRRHRHGVLSTISKKLAGYPFGSVVPFVLDHAARPVLFISRLAEHTKNIARDPHVSLLVRDAADDPQESARLTLVGNALPANDGVPELQARYFRHIPEAARLAALGDFSFYFIEPVMLRFVGGFGAIEWISADRYAPPVNALAACESDIVAHMNADHTAALCNCSRYFRHREPAAVTMTGIDCDGFDLSADGEVVRIDFDQPVVDAHMARAALAAMAARVRT